MEKRTVNATVLPVSVREAKQHMRVSIVDDDTYINHLIKAAVSYVEDATNQSLMAQTWVRYQDYFSSKLILSKFPILDVTSITYLDTASPIARQTLASTVYRLDDREGYIHRNNGEVWPNYTSTSGSIEITYRSGFVDTATSPWAGDVPPDLIHALYLIIEHWYEYRQPVVDTFRVGRVPLSAESILEQHRLIDR